LAKQKFTDGDYERFFEKFRNLSNLSQIHPLYYKLDEQNRLVARKNQWNALARLSKSCWKKWLPCTLDAFLRIRAPNSDS